MGIIPSSHLLHPLKYNDLNQTIAQIIQNNNVSIEIGTDMEKHLKILEMIFTSVNADKSYINLILPSLSKVVQVYDYPLLVALPYDRLLLSQFRNIQCSDGRQAQGIMANGKYYSLATYLYTPMSELEINRGSIIHLRFSNQMDTIVNGIVSSQPIKKTVNESYEEGKDPYCSVSCDNNTVCLMFPTTVVDSIMKTTNTSPNNGRLNYLWSSIKVSNNWTDSSKNITQLIIGDTDEIYTGDIRNPLTYQTNNSDDISSNSFGLPILVNNASSSSLQYVEKPECLNCLSYLNDDNLECPYCTQIFCRICIQSNHDRETDSYRCPKCYHHENLSAYQKSTIIKRFETEGISALECLQCHSIPILHRICRDPKCSALFCYDCCKRLNEIQTSNTTQESNSSKNIKCPQCRMSNTYVSGAVTYYTRRLAAYQIAQKIESTNSSLSNTIWKEEGCLPEIGTFEENYNRIISVIQFDAHHIEFDNNNEKKPLLVINEPSEYICPESLQLSYWNTDGGINRWENDTNIKFYKYNQSSIATYIPHLSIFTARNTRFREHIMLDEAFLDIKYDFDFTEVDDIGKTFYRGGKLYIRPCTWYRKAIRVIGKYTNEKWLDTDENAWPVAYHGTATTNTLHILRHGLLAGGSNGIRITNGERYGRGIYLSPNPSFAGSPFYAKPLMVDGQRFQVMFQVRVEPSSITECNTYIWTCNSSQNVRPYGILFKKM